MFQNRLELMNQISVEAVEVKFYDPNQPDQYYEFQAKIYNENNPETIQPATADQIKQRYESDEPDSKTIRYAFFDDTMIGYIQARVRENSKEVHVGFPWVKEKTPIEVQDKLFDELIDYIENNYKNYKLRVNINAKPEYRVAFIQKRGFVEKNRWFLNFLDLTKIKDLEYDKKFSAQLATEKDIPALLDLVKSDGRYAGQFTDDKAIKKYFRERVFKVGHLVMIYEDDLLTAAAAPLTIKLSGQKKETIILRFAAFRDITNQESFRPLLIEVARECLKSNYGSENPISVYTDGIETPKEQLKIIDALNPKKEVIFYYFYLEK